MKRKGLSFFQLTKETFSLLSSQHKKKFFKHAGLSVIQALLEVISLTAILPLFYQLLNSTTKSSATTVDILQLPGPWYLVLGAVILIFLIKNIVVLWFVHRQAEFVNSLYLDFSKKFYKYFYQQNWISYLQENSSEAFRKIKNSPYDFAHHVLFNYLQLITDGIICSLILGVVIWIDYRILVVLVALTIPVFVFHTFFRKTIIKKVDSSFRELTPKANILLAQGIDSYAEANIYHKQDYFINRFLHIIKITSTQISHLKTFANLPSRILETIAIVCFAGLIFYARLSTGLAQHVLIIVTLFSLALYRIVPSINRMLVFISQIQSYAYSISEVKERIYSNLPSKEKTDSFSFKEELQLKKVSFQYEKEQSVLLQDVTLTIKPGDFILLSGPSGAGKTTLINLLAGLVTGYQGALIIDGQTLTQDNISDWQQNIGIVPQASIILQDTILRNIAFGEADSEIDLLKVDSALKFSELHSFVQSLPRHLNTLIGENGLTLSGGQRQRLVLARAFYRDAKILLLDEVTNQLDEANKFKILNTLKELTQNNKKTIILASHDASCKSFATRVFNFQEKKVLECETVS